MRTIGIDLSLRSTGMVIHDDETNNKNYLCFLRKDFAKSKLLQELSNLGIVYFIHETTAEMITNILSVINQDNRIICEGLSYNSNSNSALDLAKAQGMLLYACHLKGCRPIEFVAPSSVKKYATGSGKATKNDMYLRYMMYNPDSNFPNKKPIEDIIDADFIVEFGLNSLFINKD